MNTEERTAWLVAKIADRPCEIAIADFPPEMKMQPIPEKISFVPLGILALGVLDQERSCFMMYYGHSAIAAVLSSPATDDFPIL
jgi:hypothetical protein